MRPTLVFVHGRGQEFKDPARLRLAWLAGLNAGLTRAALPTLPPSSAGQIAFPFYGNVLYQVTARLAQAGTEVQLEVLPHDVDTAGPLHPYTTRDVGLLERQMLADMARAGGVAITEEDAADAEATALLGLDRVLSWRAARRVLVKISDLTRVDQEIITTHLRDVAVYLTHAKEEVLSRVRADLPKAGPLVLVTHSLGTVVARHLLEDDRIRDRTALWITAGSPLGLDAVQRNLRLRGPVSPGIPWTTAYDVNDIVALGHPLHAPFDPAPHNVAVENNDRPHAIERYLSHPPVARPIHIALTSDW